MNLTNVFIDILRSAMMQTSCDMIEGLSTQDWEKIYDIRSMILVRNSNWHR